MAATADTASPRQLGSARLAQALRSGIHRVIGEQGKLNAINVFPVPDGDTGTNLSLSLGAALAPLQKPPGGQVGQLLADVADVLLDSARGNSGAIVAQFFQGLSDSAEQLTRFTTRSFATAVARGSEYARDALSNPREGTILSVINAFADNLRQQTAGEEAEEFPVLFRNALPVCRQALVRTQTQLDALRKAGVVDAGAQGFVALLEGMAEYIEHGRATPMPDDVSVEDVAPDMAAHGEADPDFRYCTECIVTGSDIDRRKLREALAEIGDSLVLAGTKRKAKIHVHVNEPDAVFQLAARYGEVSAQKADDMRLQQRSAGEDGAKFAVITDSAADISDADLERLDIHVVPLRVQFGDRGYLDKVSISAGEFFDELKRNPVHPTTSQPSPGDFRRQFQFLASHFPDVLSINLTGRVSGTLQAAESAAQRTRGGRVHVVDSLNVSLGQGLITVFAAECADAGLDIADALAAVDRAVARTWSYGLVRDLRYAVRGGRVAASRKLLADLLRLTPVLQSEPDGKVSANGILFGRRRLLPKFARYVASRVDPGTGWRAGIGHALCPAEAEELADLLRARLPELEIVTITELGAALGAHGGPGALVVSLQPRLDPADFAGGRRPG